MKIYTVTTIPATFPQRPTRCIGWFPDRDLAVEAIRDNYGDMNEDGHYRYALVEEVEEGIYTFPREEIWFKWEEIVGINRPESKYFLIDKKPNRFNQVVCFSMG